MADNDPLSKEALAKDNTYGKAVVDRLKSVFGGGAVGRAATTLSSRGRSVDAAVNEADSNNPRSTAYHGGFRDDGSTGVVQIGGR